MPWMHCSRLKGISLQIAPVSGMIAPARCGWAPLWNENHSPSQRIAEDNGKNSQDMRGPAEITS